MTWIALADSASSWTDPSLAPTGAGAMRQLMRGSLMVETRLSPDHRPQTLLGYERRHPWEGRLSLQALPGGGVVLIMALGERVFHKVLPSPEDIRAEALRLTFSWDSAANWGRLTVEHPEGDRLTMVETPAPPPILREDIHLMIHHPELCARDPDVIYFAVSDRIEPVGPAPSLMAGAPAMTADGPCPVEELKPGMQVITRERGAQPVLGVISREVPAMGSFRPIRLHAPYLGLTEDVQVSPRQRLVIDGSVVEYLFGREQVLVPAANLVNERTGERISTGRTVRYHQVLLPQHDALLVAGAAFESLYIGRIRRDKTRLAASLLARADAARLPEHHRAGIQILKAFEAITLAEARAA
ncbi:Hint domain-containing protein [Litorisediminicola beolgyonensis]|uniref:Hint domain-containing protein n=1 Tax=Litorisediminicola beolgyonensis TaxID=1173614 RepID=A0ABW3ZI14_9RHOB